MIETVIFDMDGVIIDSEPIHLETQDHLFKTFNVSLDPDEYQNYIGRSSKNMWQELIQKYGLSISVEEVLFEDRRLYHQRLITEPDLDSIPGVRDLIKNLRSEEINLILASSSSMESIDLVLSLFSMEHLFHHKVSGANLKFSKPNPEIFEVSAALVKSDPTSCLVIEDSKHGVTAAKSARMKCIGFKNPNSGDQDLADADLVVDNFEELTYARIAELVS